jgi:uracil-DNA glycosylase
LTLNLFPETAPGKAKVLAAWEPQSWPTAPDWRPHIAAWLASAQGQRLAAHLSERLAFQAVVYPPEPFRALELTSLADTRLVILGQDPYHGPGEAEGLAFSVPAGVKVPPSLRNIFKELQRDLGLAIPTNGSLVHWARQGALLLNTSLSVEQDAPASHAKKGWEALTDALIAAVAQKQKPVVFMLWGGHAQAKRPLIDAHNTHQRHLVLCANHPSPLAALRPPAPFMGCGHFGQANAFWAQNRQPAMRWVED